jgi:hypothetical protein
MQTCTNCYAQSPDDAANCANCGADLSISSTTAQALKRFQTNPRVRLVRISVAADACPACNQVQGAYPKDAAPHLPVEGCSHNHGCRCFYEPVLDEIYP